METHSLLTNVSEAHICELSVETLLWGKPATLTACGATEHCFSSDSSAHVTVDKVAFPDDDTASEREGEGCSCLGCAWGCNGRGNGRGSTSMSSGGTGCNDSVPEDVEGSMTCGCNPISFFCMDVSSGEDSGCISVTLTCDNDGDTLLELSAF